MVGRGRLQVRVGVDSRGRRLKLFRRDVVYGRASGADGWDVTYTYAVRLSFFDDDDSVATELFIAGISEQLVSVRSGVVDSVR